VDRVLELETGNTRIKRVEERHDQRTLSSPGTFPYRPVMPGVLMLEAMAQAAALMAFDSHGQVLPDDQTTSSISSGIDGARFKRPVEPGDQLILEAERWTAPVAGIYKFKAVARKSGDEVACEAELMCTMRSVG
jgi:3-hydroxyacyl-[acyl-carrier-protein] dehydratase